MTKKGKRPSPAPRRVEPAQPEPSFELRYTRDASADIKNLDGSIRKQLLKVLQKKLAIDPEGYGLPLHAPLAGYWKHEFATHRIVYRIYAEHRVVAICAVGPRKQEDVQDVYQQLKGIAKTGRLAEQLAAVLENLLPKGR